MYTVFRPNLFLPIYFNSVVRSRPVRFRRLLIFLYARRIFIISKQVRARFITRGLATGRRAFFVSPPHPSLYSYARRYKRYDT